jgi:hypothetical protein
MKKILLTVLLLALSINANAGFLTGYIVGSAMASSAKDASQPIIMTSDKNDVIQCRELEPNKCTSPSTMTGYPTITPQQYAEYSGYKMIVHRGVAIHDTNTYIIMEVTK